MISGFLKNYCSTVLFIVLAYIFYSSNDFYINFFSGGLSFVFTDFGISVRSILWTVVRLYVVLLIPYYIYYKTPSKARTVIWYFKKVISGDPSQSQKEKTAILSWLVKLFWAPLMITWLSGHIFNMFNNIYNTSQNIALFSTDFLVFFNTHFFWMAFTVILFIDVFFFTLGYLLEAPFLKNTIKSVEPTLIGWGVAIFCYPPFNTHITNLIGWYSTDFPTFANSYIHVWLNITILILMAIYSRASLALGFKASNLTNRWIITHGPYKYVRHPAYICKNAAWIIWWLPMVYLALSNNKIWFLSVLLWLIWWAFIYYLRAITEENHLSSDPEYIAYRKKVVWKFIPNIW